jgi:folate-dependent phosphoribosylglycinamide formyltransferase PurN
MNLHPAFLPFDGTADTVVMPDGSRLPAFRGARSPKATIAAGALWSGASVHRVAVAADSGAIVVRTPFALEPGADLARLHRLLAPVEHAAVAKAIRRWGFERAH